MPVKKHKIHPERKSKDKIKISKQEKQEIKEAAEQIPGLIFEHVRLQAHEEKPQIEPKKKTGHALIQYNYAQNQKKKIILWIGVIVLTATVFAMWFLNIGTAFRDLKEGYTKIVPGITETAKQSWQETMPVTPTGQPAQTKETNNLDDLKKQIKNNIISIFYAQQASTTTSSTN